MTIGVNDIEQADNVRIVHLFEQRDFADCGAGNTFVFSFEADLFEGDNSLIFGGEVSSLIYDAIRACNMNVSRGGS
jgi:hypothetical protein